MKAKQDKNYLQARKTSIFPPHGGNTKPVKEAFLFLVFCGRGTALLFPFPPRPFFFPLPQTTSPKPTRGPVSPDTFLRTPLVSSLFSFKFGPVDFFMLPDTHSSSFFFDFLWRIVWYPSPLYVLVAPGEPLLESPHYHTFSCVRCFCFPASLLVSSLKTEFAVNVLFFQTCAAHSLPFPFPLVFLFFSVLPCFPAVSVF